MRKLNFFLLFIFLWSVQSDDLVEKGRDSYLNAFKLTHGLNKHMKNKSDIQAESYQAHPVYNKPQESYNTPPSLEVNYGPSNNYGPPINSYGPPKDIYGPPKDTYGPPKDTSKENYGAKDVYGPPNGLYGPPQHFVPNNQEFYYPAGNGHSMSSTLLEILDKFKFKLDLFTIGKIILKLVIFKKIVGFVAVLCLLLFLPSLKSHKEDKYDNEQHDEMRANEIIDDLSLIVRRSIDGFHTKIDKNEGRNKCDSFACRTSRLFEYLNNHFSFTRLFQTYAEEVR